MTTRVRLIASNSESSNAEVCQHNELGRVFACDFYVSGIEHGNNVVGGYQQGRLINIDHHAPTSRMARRISSTNLAIERVHSLGTAEKSAAIIINHTDCDSILSAAIMAGELPANAEFGRAAIAADHTGEPDPIADLLQGLDKAHDYDLSFRNLLRWLQGQSLEPAAQKYLDMRLRKRGQAMRLAVKYKKHAQIAYAELSESIDSEFFPAVLLDAAVILIASPREGDTRLWNVKVRLGKAAREGLVLKPDLLRTFDPHYGGRWNAGSNKRGGGTAMPVEVYAQRLAQALFETTEYRFRAEAGK